MGKLKVEKLVEDFVEYVHALNVEVKI